MSPPSNDTATADSPIARIALFHWLSAKSLARVASIATEQRYPVGTVLFRAGDVGDLRRKLQAGAAARIA